MLGAIIIGSLSDVVFPYLGWFTLNLEIHFHLPLIEETTFVLFSALIGSLAGILMRTTKCLHSPCASLGQMRAKFSAAVARKLNKKKICGKMIIMSYSKLKTGFIFIIFVAANFLLATVCLRVYSQYEILFSPGQELLYLALWVFSSIFLIVALAGVLAALVRPFWLIVTAFALSGLVLIFVLETELIISAALGLGYLVLGVLSSRAVIKELDDRLEFSVGAIKQGQGLLVIALIMLMALNFGLGYRDEAMARDFILPPALKETIGEMIFLRIDAEIEAQIEAQQVEIGPEEKAIALAQARQEFEQGLAEAEAGMQDYARYFWLMLVFMVSGMLNVLYAFLSWIPSLLMSGIFSLLKLLGITQVVIETKEKKRLILG